MEQLGILPPSSGRDASPSQSYCPVFVRFPNIHLHRERDNVEQSFLKKQTKSPSALHKTTYTLSLKSVTFTTENPQHLESIVN